MRNTIYCVDDSNMHMSKIKAAIVEACSSRNIADYQVIECSNGRQLLDRIHEQRPTLITLDIHMPVMDGLSTLVRLRTIYSACPIVMVSAENESVILRHMIGKAGNHSNYDAPLEKKKEMLEKVAKRVRSGVSEEGKINSMLDACASLAMDPIAVAKSYGATLFLSKPFNGPEAVQKLSGFLQ